MAMIPASPAASELDLDGRRTRDAGHRPAQAAGRDEPQVGRVFSAMRTSAPGLESMRRAEVGRGVFVSVGWLARRMLSSRREVTAMIPIPHDGGIPSVPLFVNGYLDLLMVLSLVALAIVFAAMLWAARRPEQVFCPVRLRRVRVLFRLAPNGARTDVVRCAVFGQRPITCGKPCVQLMNGA
jgi:hypothetical protein